MAWHHFPVCRASAPTVRRQDGSPHLRLCGPECSHAFAHVRPAVSWVRSDWLHNPAAWQRRCWLAGGSSTARRSAMEKRLRSNSAAARSRRSRRAVGQVCLCMLHRNLTTSAEGIARARSSTEAFFYRRLESLPEMAGRFRLNVELPIPFDGWGNMEVDLLDSKSPPGHRTRWGSTPCQHGGVSPRSPQRCFAAGTRVLCVEVSGRGRWQALGRCAGCDSPNAGLTGQRIVRLILPAGPHHCVTRRDILIYRFWYLIDDRKSEGYASDLIHWANGHASSRAFGACEQSRSR